MSTPACMGGFCRKRDRCAHYHADDRREPAERLCMPGADGVGMQEPVRFHLPVGAWERADTSALISRAQPFDALQVIV